jgi:hypothetical protein
MKLQVTVAVSKLVAATKTKVRSHILSDPKKEIVIDLNILLLLLLLLLLFVQDFKRLHEGLEVLGEFGLTQAEKYKNNPKRYGVYSQQICLFWCLWIPRFFIIFVDYDLFFKFEEKSKAFGEQLKEFSKNLHVVLNNCIRINDFKFDPYISAELFYETSVLLILTFTLPLFLLHFKDSLSQRNESL